MATVTLYGPPPCSYVRTARMTCAAKGVDHELIAVEPSSPQHRALHPFAGAPVMEHGPVQLYETQAIIRYIDAAFEGTSLVPSRAASLGTMEQWISIHNCYLYEHLVRDYAFAYLMPQGENDQPDRCAIEAAVPAMEHDIAVLDGALEGREWVAGSFSLADLLLGPVLATVAPLPEGRAIIDRSPNVRRWLTAIEDRPSGPLLIPPRSHACYAAGHRARWNTSGSAPPAPAHRPPASQHPDPVEPRTR